MTLSNKKEIYIIVLMASVIMMITMGVRQSTGLFVSPINTSTGLGIVNISLALAIAQISWGAIQPIAGAIADQYGPKPILMGGILLLALGMGITPFMTSTLGLIFSMGLLTAIGSGSCSFSVLLGAAYQRLPKETHGKASGIINGGSSFGQFIFAPISQKLIQSFGWINATWSLTCITLLALPLINLMTRDSKVKEEKTNQKKSTLKVIKRCIKNNSYIYLHLGFFTCGFHVAFLVTHLPMEISLCGLPSNVAGWSIAIIGLTNIFGSIYTGVLINKYKSKYILALMYVSRSLLIILYLLAPKTEITLYIFAAGLGLTWLATVPPTAAIVGKLFGVNYLGTLFGLTLFSHQIGGFLGAYLGGLAINSYGNYYWMWFLDIILSFFAALINLPIKERSIKLLDT